VAPANEDFQLRSALIRLAEDHADSVELMAQPLSSEDYDAAIRQADVLLVPYDPTAYSLRSSGVFAEALAAGKVCISTTGSWMDRVHASALGHVLSAQTGSAAGWRPDVPVPGTGEALCVRARLQLLPVAGQEEAALFRAAQQLRGMLQPDPASEAVPPVLVGMTDSELWILIRQPLAAAAGLGKTLRQVMRSLLLDWEVSSVPAARFRSLGAGVRIVPDDPASIARTLVQVATNWNDATNDARLMRDATRDVHSNAIVAQVLARVSPS
jgi:hypothetical protein